LNQPIGNHTVADYESKLEGSANPSASRSEIGSSHGGREMLAGGGDDTSSSCAIVKSWDGGDAGRLPATRGASQTLCRVSSAFTCGVACPSMKITRRMFFIKLSHHRFGGYH
jgi:hypothetical protein